MSNFTIFLRDKIKKEKVNTREVKRLGHFADLGNLDSKVLRSRTILVTPATSIPALTDPPINLAKSHQKKIQFSKN